MPRVGVMRRARALASSLALLATIVPASVHAAVGLPAPPVPVPALPGAPAAAGGAVSSANVTFVANIPDVVAIGSKVVGNTLYVNTAQGVRIYDVSLGLPVPMGAIDIPHFQNEDIDTNGKILLVASDHFLGVNNSLYVFDVSNGHVPVLLGALRNLTMAHTATCIQDCKYAWLGGGGGRIGVVDLRNPSAITYMGSFPSFGSIHDVQVDAQGIAWVSSSAGLFGYKQSAYALRPTLVAYGVGWHNKFTIHNSLRPYAKSWKRATTYGSAIQPGELTLVTEENWLAPLETGQGGNSACRDDGRFQTGAYRQYTWEPYGTVYTLDTFNVGQGTQGDLTGSRHGPPMLTCSSHYFGYKDYVAAVAWYEQGVRFLDVKDPRNIRQIGYWLPVRGAAWSAQFVKDYVYVFDAVRGMDILRFTRSGSTSVMAPFLNPPLPGLSTPDQRFGYACRLIGGSS